MDTCSSLNVGNVALDNENDGKVLAFFVDYGFEREVDRENIFEIPPEFVSVLPFQAIRCALYNIRTTAVADCAEEEAGDLLFNLGSGSGADSAEIDVMNMGVVPKSEENNGEKAFFVSIQGGRFEHELVRKNVAEYVDENMALFDGAEIDQGGQNGNPSAPPIEPDQAHSEEESRLLDMLEDMEKTARDPQEVNVPLPSRNQQEPHITTTKSSTAAALLPNLNKPDRPDKMPALAVVEGVTPLSRRLPPSSVRWHQDRTRRLIVKVDLELNFDLDRRSCYIHVENKRIEFHYLEIACVKGETDKELYHLHELPTLHLFSTVDPKTTEVVFNPR